MADLAGKQVAIWGVGVEGCAGARFALRCGAASVVGVVDAMAADLTAWSAASGDAAVLEGTAGEAALRAADVVLRSPGISIHRPLVTELPCVVGGTALFLEERGADVIAVTGSKGKSTTSALIAHLLVALGRDAVHAGNIGVATLDLLDQPRRELYVLEVSSFQASDVTVSPRVVVLTSLFPEHLDWHGDEATYYADKLNLAAHSPEVVVANENDARQRELLAGRTDVLWYSGAAPLFDPPPTKLVGVHNASNIAAALTALQAIGVDVLAEKARISEALASFQPLEHRLEVVASVESVDYVDDSLATSPHAAIAALEAFADRPVTLIAGGHDRGVPWQPLAEHIKKRSEWTAVVTLPITGPALSALLAKAQITTADVADLRQAVELASEITPPGGVVLLSPAAPSFGQFANYADRSRAFRESVAALS